MAHGAFLLLAIFAGWAGVDTINLRVGEALPALALNKEPPRGPAVVLFCRHAERPAAVEAIRSRLQKSNIPVLVATPDADGKNFPWYAAVLVEDGVVRRIVTAPEKVADEVLAWRKGQAIYQGMCARCHGADGADTSYSGIKPLAGLGRRISEREIARRTGMTGTVDLSSLTDDDRWALASYVAGL